MQITSAHVTIFSNYDRVEPHLDEIRKTADAQTLELGFLPHSVYSEAAQQEHLLVAVASQANKSIYLGHLMYGFVFPNARIFQTFVRADVRGVGVGRKLVEALVSRAERSQFMNIIASVADDLGANQFWQKLGFNVVRTKPGKGNQGRIINVRLKELTTPTLFDPVGGFAGDEQTEKLFVEKFSGPSPIYAIDLNVLFDVTKRRSNARLAGKIIQAGFKNLVRLAVTKEFIRELERSTSNFPADPILELANNLPVLTEPSKQALDKGTLELAPLVFPERHRKGSLTEQDLSDLSHLFIASHNKARGFVTSEKAILGARKNILQKLGLEVVGASEFAHMVDSGNYEKSPPIQVNSCGANVSARVVQNEDDPGVQSLFQLTRAEEKLTAAAFRSALGETKNRVLVECEGQPIALGTWETSSQIKPQLDASIIADEDQGAVELAIEHLLDLMMKESLRHSSNLIRLSFPPGHIASARLAIRYGFRPDRPGSSSRANYHKLCVGRIVDAKSWGEMRTLLERISGLVLPLDIPKYSSPNQPIKVRTHEGKPVLISLLELEGILRPVLFFLPDRPGALIPIERAFAEDLLGGHPQASLLVGPEAGLLTEKVYFSAKRNLKLLPGGTPILFYESGKHNGRACVSACARVVRSELVWKKHVGAVHSRRGVLDAHLLEKISNKSSLTATTFDNIFCFPVPVPLRLLREFKLLNLISTRPVSHELMKKILREGKLI